MTTHQDPSARPIEQPRPTVEVDGMPLSEGFPMRRLLIIVLDGPDAGKVHTIESPNIRFGADPLCDVVLSDPTVSRNHAELRQRGPAYALTDLGSTNGTYLNNVRVDNVALAPGTVFRLGRTKLRFDVKLEKVSIETTKQTHYDNIIGGSRALREIFSILDRVAPSELSVVIEGETGSGKELIAQALHTHSDRKKGPFVVFDCSSFPPSLLESELFGHEKGAFTGAVGRHVGVFERAHGGTLFFDELGELDMEFQAKFLRVLETGELRRVGGEKTINVDVRMVSATNRDLEQMVQQRAFRSDLFYRLAQVRFWLPPLRERLEDIPLLITHFLDQQAARTGRRPMIDQEAFAVLQGYPWPGNIRQLRNAIEKAVAMCRDGVISADYFRQELTSAPGRVGALGARAPGRVSAPGAQPQGAPLGVAQPVAASATPAPQVASLQAPMLDAQGKIIPFKDIKEELISSFERQYIALLLDRAGMNISRAARQAGIDRRHFYRLLAKHDITPVDDEG